MFFGAKCWCIYSAAYPGNATAATTETASTTSANRDSKQHANIQAAGRASRSKPKCWTESQRWSRLITATVADNKICTRSTHAATTGEETTQGYLGQHNGPPRSVPKNFSYMHLSTSNLPTRVYTIIYYKRKQAQLVQETASNDHTFAFVYVYILLGTLGWKPWDDCDKLEHIATQLGWHPQLENVSWVPYHFEWPLRTSVQHLVVKTLQQPQNLITVSESISTVWLIKLVGVAIG